MDEKIPVRHIIIDEAQDFSAFQIYVHEADCQGQLL
jgi:DNA helicase-2/ATP-dependent DNA helicase PcrA